MSLTVVLKAPSPDSRGYALCEPPVPESVHRENDMAQPGSAAAAE